MPCIVNRSSAHPDPPEGAITPLDLDLLAFDVLSVLDRSRERPLVRKVRPSVRVRSLPALVLRDAFRRDEFVPPDAGDLVVAEYELPRGCLGNDHACGELTENGFEP